MEKSKTRIEFIEKIKYLDKTISSFSLYQSLINSKKIKNIIDIDSNDAMLQDWTNTGKDIQRAINNYGKITRRSRRISQ